MLDRVGKGVLCRPGAVGRFMTFRALRASTLAPLVSPSPGEKAFLRCAECQKLLTSPALCGHCLGVSYCSPTCQAQNAARVHSGECDNFIRYMRRDVRVALGSDPQWLRSAMNHRGDMPYCDLLEQMGSHKGAYRLLCGCQGAPSPHRHLIEPIEGSADMDGVMLDSWDDYYDQRGLSPNSPYALPSTFPPH